MLELRVVWLKTESVDVGDLRRLPLKLSEIMPHYLTPALSVLCTNRIGEVDMNRGLFLLFQGSSDGRAAAC